MIAAPIAKALSGAVKKISKVTPTHGTDVSNLRGILKTGLRRGSALDITPEKEWAKEYPVILEVPKARPGRFIEHNKFYESANTAMPSRITVDLDQYTDDAAEEAFNEINKLKTEYPGVKWYVKGAKPLDDPDRLTKKNLLTYYTKEMDINLEEAEKLVKTELADIRENVPQRMLGYPKSIHNMTSYKAYMDWLMQQ